MSTLYAPGGTSPSWQNRDAGTLNDTWGADIQNAPTFIPVSDYEAGRRDGVMIGLILGALSGAIISMLIGFIIW